MKYRVEEYNFLWPEMYQLEKNLIVNKLSGVNFEIYHIGSTSVPGLSAKPIIDILLVSDDFEVIIKELGDLGYNAIGEFNIPFHECMNKRIEEKNVNLHLYNMGHPEIKLNLLFRDFLRDHKVWRDKYGDLKKKLSKQEGAFEKGKQGVKLYTLAKNDLIVEILEKAGFDEYSLKYCMHANEWKQFYSILNIKPEIEVEEVHNRTKFYFVLYQGTKIVAAAIIENYEIRKIAAKSNNSEYLQEIDLQLKKWILWKNRAAH